MSNIFGTKSKPIDDIPVKIGAPLLDVFSAQLYSSPQKAFEELIVNGWDAGASHIDVIIPEHLRSQDAALMVIDNGDSMDIQGLEKLWSIAISDKKDNPQNNGRPVIGKFGVGKLATYLLADEFTYVCRAKDGIIRYVTMDYKDTRMSADKLVAEIGLPVYEITENEFFTQLKKKFPQKAEDAIKFIKGENLKTIDEHVDEYNYSDQAPALTKKETWTLVILSELKEMGQNLKVGILKNMLRAALPLGKSVNIRLNDGLIKPKGEDALIIKTWGLTKDDIKNHFKESLEVLFEGKSEKALISYQSDGSIEIEGIEGKITGKFTLYQNQISSRKSTERGVDSHGFYVNVLGRVVNQAGNYFGTKNMHHGTWPRFRCTVRADGLNRYLNVHRESFREVKEVAIFREFLRKLFNIARTLYESNEKSILTEMEDIWVKKLGHIVTSPLIDFINSTAKAGNDFRKSFFQMKDADKNLEEWNKSLSVEGEKVIKAVKIGKLSPDYSGNDLVKYDISTKSIVLNENHPFVLEFAVGRGEKSILEAVMSAVFLSDIYSLDVGVEDAQLQKIIRYREKIMNAKAMAKRENVITVIEFLRQSQRDSSEHALFEQALSSAFRCLGFDVEHKGKTGEPEGIAYATVLPGIESDTDKKNAYKFIYDAKTTNQGAVQTKDLNLDAIRQHKDECKADYAIIVAPDYQIQTTGNRLMKALEEEGNKGILCFTTSQLIELLRVTGLYGTIAHDKFREIFELSIGIDKAIDEKIKSIREYKEQKAANFSLKDLLHALRTVESHAKINKELPVDTIAYSCSVTADVVLPLVKALDALVPQYVVVEGKNVYLKANIGTIIREFERVTSQIEVDRKENG